MQHAKSLIRIVFGAIWAVDASFKWSPAFSREYLGLLQDASRGQPAWLRPWFSFWVHLVSGRVGAFALLTALLESYIAVALILGFARKVTYILASAFSLLIWSTAEGFGGPYTPGATDVGTGLIYALVFLSLLALNAQAGPSRLSVDWWIQQRWPWWQRVAEVRAADSSSSQASAGA